MNNFKLHSKATTLKCLGRKLELQSLDPDPKAERELTREYNCKNCSDNTFCDKVYQMLRGMAR